MKILIAPIEKYSQRSKLALILKHIGWDIVNENPDVHLWISDSRQPNPLFYNWRGCSLDKQVVSDAFRGVFGYEVGVDPEIYVGKAVEKKLDHGTHGQVVKCPRKPMRDRCYQKLLGNRNDGFTDEYRLDVFRSEMIVTLKHQVLQKSGMPQEMRTPESSEFDLVLSEHFNADEHAKLMDFCVAIGMDYGALDAIRDRDGRLYVIDATTNIGVPEMSWHKNLTLDEYICRQATTFEKNFTP